MIPKAKEFLIIDPLDVSDTLDCTAKVINIMVQHLLWLQKASTEEIDAAKDDKEKCQMNAMNFTDESMEDFGVFKVKPGSDMMPKQKDNENCGLFAIILCESHMRGFLPTFQTETLESICKHCHLESSLASGVPLLGDRSVHLPLACSSHGNKLSSYQKGVFQLMPRQIKFSEDNWQASTTNEDIGRVISPMSDETVKFHCKPFELLGSKLFTKNTKGSLLHCCGCLSEMIAKTERQKILSVERLQMPLRIRLNQMNLNGLMLIKME